MARATSRLVSMAIKQVLKPTLLVLEVKIPWEAWVEWAAWVCLEWAAWACLE